MTQLKYGSIFTQASPQENSNKNIDILNYSVPLDKQIIIEHSTILPIDKKKPKKISGSKYMKKSNSKYKKKYNAKKKSLSKSRNKKNAGSKKYFDVFH